MPTSANVTDPIEAPAATFTVHHVEVEEGVELRVFEWRPGEPESEDPLVFVAGWVSAIEGWADLLRALVAVRPVYYVESREKRSARIARRRLTFEDFTIARMAKDLIAVSAALGLDGSRPIYCGSSMGSTGILEALKGGRLPAGGAFVIGPNAQFRFPWWGKALVRVPTEGYAVVIRIVLFYLRNFRVNSRLEPQQMERYERTLLGAHPLRMKLSARAVYPYEIWPELETVSVPVAIAHAPTDTLHAEDEIARIVATIPEGRPVRCPTNLYMHCADVAADIEAFIAGSPTRPRPDSGGGRRC